MTPVFDASQALAWLQTLYSETEGLINICSTNNWAGECFTTPEAAIKYIHRLDAQGAQGIYARVTTLAKQPLPDADGRTRRGSVSESLEFVGFWADLDLAGPGHKTSNVLPADEHDLINIIDAAGLPEPTEWVHSGGGMYPWWLLETPVILSGEDMPMAIELAAQWQRLIELASNSLGFSYGAGVGDLARVLRVPGTINRKVADNPRPCVWRQDMGTGNAFRLETLTRILGEKLRQLEPLKPEPKRPEIPAQRASGDFVGGTRPGDAFNAATNWFDLLTADGAQLDSDRAGYCEWVRPGKDKRDGISGTTGYMGSDVLKVFTDSWPDLRQGETYDRFGYYAATRHNGNIADAARALSALGYGEKGERSTSVPVQAWDYTSEKPETIKALTEKFSANPVTTKPTYTLTESGFADRMYARYGNDWRFVATRQRFGWLHWDGTVWQADKTGTVTDFVDRMVQEEYMRLDEEEDQDKAAKMRDALRKMLRNATQVGTTALFARRRGVAIDSADLDRHVSKVTCTNGVLDLAGMSFSGHDRDLLATKKLGVAYDPDATCPKWDKFLAEVLPSEDMRGYLQRAIGYTLLGNPVAKAVFMLHGPSHTGKSQVINALAAVFGDFAENAKEQTFRVSDSVNGPTPSLHKLRGARLVTASESTEGVKLDESLLKRLTGGDEICSRPLYGDEETWLPQFSIWLATNYLPKFNSDDNAIWRRVKPIKFDQVFGTEGRGEVFDIGRKLVAEEGPGILNWILSGVVQYLANGLQEPDELRVGVAAYQTDADPVARFLDDYLAQGMLAKDADEQIESNILYSWFQTWCEDEGIRFPLARNRFGRRLAALGYTSGRDVGRTKRVWSGLGRGSVSGPAVWLGGSPSRGFAVGGPVISG